MNLIKIENYLKTIQKKLRKNNNYDKNLLNTLNVLNKFLKFLNLKDSDILKKKKKGMSLLEVIFNIIILSLVLSIFLSIYESITINIKRDNLNNLLFNSENLLNNILIRNYDEKNSEDITNSLINNGNKYLLKPRIGKSQLNNNDNRKINDKVETEPKKLGLDTGEINNDLSTYDDIDDFNNYVIENSLYKIKIETFYTNDDADYSNNNNKITFKYDKINKKTNIKTIKVKGYSKINNKKMVFYYNSTNIGGTHLFRLSEIKR